MVTDHARAEVGVVPLELTDAGRRDPVFSPLGSPFPAVFGHEDIVDDLPPDAVSLASSATIENEALMFPGKPIYATQFHPELDRDDLIQRIAVYSHYLKLTGASVPSKNSAPSLPKPRARPASCADSWRRSWRNRERRQASRRGPADRQRGPQVRKTP